MDADIEALIEERKQARKAKNFARADEIRKELADKGILLEDTRQGVTWKACVIKNQKDIERGNTWNKISSCLNRSNRNFY